MQACPRPLFPLLIVTGLAWVDMFGQHPTTFTPEPRCSGVVLRFRLLRQPPIFYRGETIQGRLSLSANRPLGLTTLPESRRGFFEEIMVWKPSNGAIDPSTRDNRIRVGSTLDAGCRKTAIATLTSMNLYNS